MPTIPLSLQLFSIRDETKLDFAQAVQQVAAIGYPAVELAGYGNLDVKAAKAALDANRLALSGIHVGHAAFQRDLDQVIDDALFLGVRDVILAVWPKTHYVSVAAVESIGEQLNLAGARFRALGLRLSFHNHAAEFALLEGRPVLDWMLGASEPRNLGLQLDLYWAHVGAGDAAAVLRKHGARTRTVHLRDADQLGQGPVDFGAVFSTIEAIGATEWYVVEHGPSPVPPMETVRRSYQWLKQQGK